MTRPEASATRVPADRVPARRTSSSTDANLWGALSRWRDRRLDEPPELYTLTGRAECPGEPAYVEIAFERGVPTAINGVADAAARADRQPRHASPRRTASAGCADGAACASCAKRRPPSCCTRRTASCSTSVTTDDARALLAPSSSREYADLVLQRPVVLAAARSARCVRRAPCRSASTGIVRLKLFRRLRDRPGHRGAVRAKARHASPRNALTTIRQRARSPQRSTRRRISGRAASTPRPTRPRSNSARRSASIAACSKTM